MPEAHSAAAVEAPLISKTPVAREAASESPPAARVGRLTGGGVCGGGRVAGEAAVGPGPGLVRVLLGPVRVKRFR